MGIVRNSLVRSGCRLGLILVLSVGGGAPAGERKLYWGDLHNHNAVGYARGSLERSYEIARSHLDFFAFTGHAQWHDLKTMPQNKHQKWPDGFAVLRENWEKVKKLARENYAPGRFVTFVAYEWHSSTFGDYCVYYPTDTKAPLAYFDHVADLQAHAKATGALIIPHHPGYRGDWRGANFDHLDTTVSPVVEFFSEHGCAEHDRVPGAYLRHSMGGRWTTNTMRALLERGVRVGVIASTDDHLGYPGAYRQGLVGLYADALTREGIFEALRARRTYAVTGDRIELDVRINGRPMGDALPATDRREITVRAAGWGEIDRIEIVKNNRVIARTFPVDNVLDPPPWSEPVLCRVEFGWGPWGDLNMARVCDWDFDIDVQDGRIIDVQGCFRSGPFDEQRRNVIKGKSANKLSVRSYTSRIQPLGDLVTNAVVLKLQGGPATKLTLTLRRPAEIRVVKRLDDLAAGSAVAFTGPFTSESLLLHRLVFAPQHRASWTVVDWRDGREGRGADWYYARVVQSNGDLAFCSPIWVERPEAGRSGAAR